MLSVTNIPLSYEAKSSILASVDGNLGRMSIEALEAASILTDANPDSMPDALRQVDEILNDLTVFKDLFKSPILNQLMMR